MSARPNDTARPVELVELEIDGHPVKAAKGSMIIQAADAASIPIPRFCYHKKLPIAAVCRQCMVEVEMGGRKVAKPQVACATPVAAGMKVFTKTPLAVHAQQNALEFVLINHPLDCPICEQGGECELQDLAMGYGRGLSRFTERKRTITDENVGPLVATEMTRCIHCTRCVRFLGEVAGSYEFGDFDRGDRHVIGTWIGRGIGSELSGNVIDVCPVGALTDKVSQFKARAWELIAKASIGCHDALGSNLWLHTKRSQVLRAVPRDNEAINECWLADRDRYSHEGLYAGDRAKQPLVRKGDELVAVEWDEAIAFVAAGLRDAAGDVAALVAPMASCEEGYLLAQLLRGLGSERIDHRLRIQDFSDGGPAGATFEMPVAAIAEIRAGLLVGSDLRHELPLVNQRVRRATRHDATRPHVANIAAYDIAEVHGAAIHVLNPVRFEWNYDLASETVVAPQAFVAALAKVAAAAGVAGAGLPQPVAALVASSQADEGARAIVASLRAVADSVVILGDIATQHPDAAWLRALARAIAQATASAYDELPAGANAVGLARVGAQSGDAHHTARAILEDPPKALVTWQAGAEDSFVPAAFERVCEGAALHVHIGGYADASVRRTAAAILPVGLPPETDGTWVNVDGFVQAVAAGAAAPGEARPGWKVLRALGGALGLPGFDFIDLGDVHARIAAHVATPVAVVAGRVAPREAATNGTLVRLGTVGIYRGDAIVRRAKALQRHVLNREPALRICADDARTLGLLTGVKADVDGVRLPVVVDAAVPRGCAWIEAGHPATAALPPYGAILAIKAATA